MTKEQKQIMENLANSSEGHVLMDVLDEYARELEQEPLKYLDNPNYESISRSCLLAANKVRELQTQLGLLKPKGKSEKKVM